MERNQPAVSQNLTRSKVQPQQTGSNQKLFIAVVISVLLSAIITGSIIYFWQKSVSERVISNLEQKITSLEGQVSVMKKPEIASQQTLPPASTQDTSPTNAVEEIFDWIVYRNEDYGFQIKYPPYYASTPVGYPGPSENVLLLLSDFSIKQENNFVPLLNVTIHKQADDPTFDESIIGSLSHTQEVGGLDAKIYKQDTYVSGYTALITFHNGNILEVRVDQMQDSKVALDRFNQILSTFQVIR